MGRSLRVLEASAEEDEDAAPVIVGTAVDEEGVIARINASFVPLPV